MKVHNNIGKLPRSVGIVYSEVKREYFPTEAQFITEKDALSDARVIADHIDKLGIKTFLYEGTPNFVISIKKDKPDIVINLVGSVNGQEYLAAAIPGMLESLRIPYTGAGILGESLNYNKFLTKDLLNSHGVPVPNFQLIPDLHTPLYQNLRFPLISKLNEIHGSVEITKDSVSENEKHLRERIKYLINTYKQSVLIEEFITGKEITAYLIEGKNKKVYLAEKIFKESDNKYKFADFESEWLDYGDFYKYQKYEDKDLNKYVRRAFNVLRMDDYGKFDVRIDESGRYYFIDANTNPYFGPKELSSPLTYVLELYGINFDEILVRILSNTMEFKFA